MKTFRIVNNLHSSNTFILNTDHSNEVIVVDLGDPDNGLLVNWLEAQNKKIHSILLTHEHADHCSGLMELGSQYKLFCTKQCAENMGNSKRNFSYYMDIVPAFEINSESTQVADGETIQICGTNFTFIHTPGHSPGSMVIFADHMVFTGDTLMEKSKTPLNLPNSNKRDYADSLRKIAERLTPGMVIYPGHGEPFVFSSWEQFAWYKREKLFF